MPEADTEHGNFPREVFDGFRRHSSIFDRFSWTGRDNEMIGLEGDQLVQCNLVIAEDLYVRPKLAEVLDKVIGEGVIVIN
jgi:hypothetical protein